MDNYILFLFIGIVTLIPIIPAFIFFKVIPTQQSDVEGTFAGLKFKLGGSFGGYFLILFVLITLFKGSIEDTDAWQIWEIEGEVVFDGGAGSTSAIELKIDPPTFQPLGNQIKLKVLKKPGHDGEMEMPNIYVSHENFIPAFIEFSDEDEVDKKHRKVKISKPIVLTKEPI